MPTLIPEIARAMTESIRRATTSVAEEIERIERLNERVEELRVLKAEDEALRRRVAREARSATRDVAEEAHEVEDLWSAAVKLLREGLSAEEQLMALRVFADLAGSGLDYCESVRGTWALVERMGGDVGGAEALDDASRLLDRVRIEAIRALEIRATPWQPSDPARYERGRREVEEGKAVSPDAARARFRTNRELA